MPLTNCILGIDPGLTGALALLDPIARTLEITDVPTITARSGKRSIDEHALAAIIRDWAPRIADVWIEQVGTRPGEGHVGAFSFGRSVGALRGVCAGLLLPIWEVTPQTWKRTLTVTADKDHARTRATEVFPADAALWSRKMDHNRAEAALIALYGWHQRAD